MTSFPNMRMQANIVDFLRQPDSYDTNPGRVETMETHSSYVFLAGPLAYKMKRKVKYPFLDFSTLPKRLEAAKNELLVNLRNAPDLYLGLTAVVETGAGKYELHDNQPPKEGNVVEWLVKMKRFAQEDIYSNLAREGKITVADAQPLAIMAAELHARAPIIKDFEKAARSVRLVRDEMIDFLSSHDKVIDQSVTNVIVERCDSIVESSEGILTRRAENGYFRHGHGDLHLANIVKIEGKPVAFDAIEFDDNIATTDVLYDLAFLLMDLWHCEQFDVANGVLNHYLAPIRTPIDAYDGLTPLPLFLALRALIRLMAATLKNEQRGCGRLSDKNPDIDIYSVLAKRCLEDKRPRLVAIGGLSGTGKTTYARRIAPLLGRVPGAIILRSDVERKAMFSVNETSRLPQTAYSREITDNVYKSLQEKAARILAAGHSVIVDAVHALPAQRQALRALARSQNADYTGIWLTASETEMVRRIESRRGDASDATDTIVAQQLKYEFGDIDWEKVDTSVGIDATTKKIRALLDAADRE